MYIGVCDEAARYAWGLLPAQGHLRRWSRDLDGRVRGRPRPASYPDGHCRQVMFDAMGRPSDLHGKATGVTIQVIVDADAGTLAYRIGRGPELPALSGFPRGVALRPWARVLVPDRLSIRPCVDEGRE